MKDKEACFNCLFSQLGGFVMYIDVFSICIVFSLF